MNITITKGGKEFEFKYSVEKPAVTRGAQKQLSFHKWKCDELSASGGPCETFFGEYDNSGITKDQLKERAEKFINALPQVKSIVDIEVKADVVIEEEPVAAIVEEVIESVVEEEVATEDEPTIEDFTKEEEPKEESFFTKLKNKITNN